MADYSRTTWIDDDGTATVGTLVTAARMNGLEAEMVKASGKTVWNAQAILDVGVASQIRAGRVFTLADYTTILGLSTPIGLWNLGDGSDISGNSLTMTNKGSPTFGKGIMGATTEALILDGASCLYRGTVGSGTAGRIAYGSWGVWARTARRSGGTQVVISREANTNAGSDWEIAIQNGGIVRCGVFIGGAFTSATSATDVADDRWHFLVATYDGSLLRCYVDGRLENTTAATGPINQGTQPLNIGGWGADGSTAVSQGLFGRIDEAFVLPDVLTPEQVRFLYCAKVAHGLSSTPSRLDLAVRRFRKTAPPFEVFSVAPKHLYAFAPGAQLTDSGSLSTALTNNGTALAVPGVDGLSGGAFQFNGSSQYMSCSDTGLPTTTAARSMGCWFKTTYLGTATLMNYGTGGGNNQFILYLDPRLVFGDGSSPVAAAAGACTDGRWHLAIGTYDAAAVDGQKFKLYVDGVLVGSSTAAINTTTLSGANGFRIGSNLALTSYFPGSIDGAFVTDYAMIQSEISSIYAQGSLSLGASPKNVGDHVERVDSTNVYAAFDTIETQNQVDLLVAA